MKEISKWQPNISVSNLLKRTKIIKEIRNFFYDRNVLEVETPCMSKSSTTDVNLVPFKTILKYPENNYQETDCYLMTSPEFHMKRLLSVMRIPIFQLFHSFRNEEIGRYHNPEFTILEWYRPNYNMYYMMSEVSDLLKMILKCYSKTKVISYQRIFKHYLAIDPLLADVIQLKKIAKNLDVTSNLDLNNEDDISSLLQILFSTYIEPYLGQDGQITFIYNFPACQASLAKISNEDKRVAERFEVYYRGIELANGFHELTDSNEQLRRFELDNYKRLSLGLSKQPIDYHLLDALDSNMPDSSGVALGIDRLVMLALSAEQISDVIPFNIDRA